ncbi:hypothetical protein MUP65_00245 [Patescibacteria group bacterium]|nr:hypothetical protein [Patescibacteria group bacterium]
MKKTKKTSRFLIPLFQFGSIVNPWSTIAPDADYPDNASGIITILNNLLRTAIVVAGLYAFINVITAGYEFMSAAGNPDKVTSAWSKIWQSMLGLVVVASSFVLAGIFGYLIFNDPTAILNPRVYGPGTP